MNDTQTRATILGAKLNTLSSNIGIFATELENDINTILGTVDADIVAAQTHVNNCQRELDELQKTVSISSLSSPIMLIFRSHSSTTPTHLSTRRLEAPLGVSSSDAPPVSPALASSSPRSPSSSPGWPSCLSWARVSLRQCTRARCMVRSPTRNMSFKLTLIE